MNSARYDRANLTQFRRSPPDDTIRWLSHAGNHAKRQRHFGCRPSLGVEVGSSAGRPRIGVANNVRTDDDVRTHFEEAVRSIGDVGYQLTSAAAPLYEVREGIGTIESDRAAISGRAFQDVDLILLPTTASVTPTINVAAKNQLAPSPENTAFANYYGLPAITVPCGFDSRGRPIGLQIVGKRGDDGAVLAMAQEYERIRDSATPGRRYPIP